MSQYHGNDDECPECGLRYRDLRTGLTYEDVFLMFWRGPDDPSQWRYKKRHTVLGKWHQIKREMWAQHLSECEGPTFDDSEWEGCDDDDED